jgi:hypothetical protein
MDKPMTRPISGLVLVSLSLLLLGTTAILSSCSFGDDNVGDVYGPAAAAPRSTPQLPESMKTGTVTGEPSDGPPQGL